MALRDPHFGNAGVLTVENLIAGDFPRHTDTVIIAAGETLTMGGVLGEVTADGTFKLSVAAATDGSEVPIAILQNDVDASLGATKAAVWLTGCFNEDALNFGAGHTKVTTKSDLRSRSLFLKPIVGA